MPIKMSKYWNIQEAFTFIFWNLHFSVFESLSKKLFWAFDWLAIKEHLLQYNYLEWNLIRNLKEFSLT